MSDSEDDAGAALPRQKSIFSTMGRVRNMNHLREKWNARAKLSSSGNSDFGSEATASSTSTSNMSASMMAVAQLQTKKRQGHTAPAAPSPSAVLIRPVEPPRHALSVADAQRYETLSAWMRRSGLSVPARDESQRKDSVFDELYDSLDDMEAAVKQELAQLLPKWRVTPGAEAPVRTRSSPVVDYTVVIGPDFADLSTRAYWFGEENVYEASVVFAHPPQSQFNAECIEQFCFPRGVTTSSRTVHDGLQNEEEFFVLVISGGGDQGQSVQYACCLRRRIGIVDPTHASGGELSVPVCYAVVVSTPWIPFFYQLLRHLAERHQQDLRHLTTDEAVSSVVPDSLAQQIDSIMSAMAEIELPEFGGTARVILPSERGSAAEFCLSRPRIDCGAPETVDLLLNWAMPQLLSALSIPRIIIVIGLLLVEMKVIVVSTSMPLLSAGTVGLSALLHPLSWAGPLISILPPALHEYLEAPVPLLCGVEVLPTHFYLTKGTAILLVDKDEIQLHPDDAAQLGALQFPGSEELSRQLVAFSDRMRAASGARSSVVVANFVLRRIRRQLLDLLQLCARVNPCNAYACMKQEQLSLSETLFLKAFMQSQMYQKYSDDQPHLLETENKPPNSEASASNARENGEAPASRGQLTISRNLRSSIRDLLLISTTGSCSQTEMLTTSPSLVKDGPARGPEINAFDDDGETRETTSIQASTYSANDRDAGTSSNKRLSRAGTSNSASPVASIPNWDLEPLGSTAIISRSVVEHPGGTHLTASSVAESSQVVLVDEEGNTVPVTSRMGEQQDQASASVVRLGSASSVGQYSPSDMFANISRSMPDVLLDPERRISSSTRAETETLDGMALWQLAISTHEQDEYKADQSTKDLAPTVSATPPDDSVERNSVILTKAAIKLQTAWRKQRRQNASRRPPSRGRSFGSSQSANEAVLFSRHGEVSEADLRLGIVLSTAECSKLFDVVMRLSEDARVLQWYHLQKLRGAIPLIDVQEVKAQHGDIVIQTSAGRIFRFFVPPQRANEVMAFFQGLHRLATSAPSSVTSSSAALMDASDPPRTSFASRHDSNLQDTSSMAKEVSSQDTKRTSPGGSPDGSSFISFDESMRRGLLVLKHGRMGRPHPKFLVCDEAFETLSWVDPIVTNAGFLPPGPAQPLNRQEKKGVRFDDILELLRGKQTRVFQRSTAGRSNAELCFSVITRGRTLDIETFSRDDRLLLVDGISQRMTANSSSG